jgi:hypothetical protein
MKTNRYAAERGIEDGRAGAGPSGNPFRNAERRDLWERGRINGALGGFPCGAIAPNPPTLVCLCGHHNGER